MENLEITTGLNYDYDLASIFFQDNFEVLQHQGYRQNSILLYTSYNELSNSYFIDEDVEIIENKQNRVNCLKLLIKDFDFYYSDIKDSAYDDMINYIINDYDLNSIDELLELLDYSNIEYKRNYIIMTSRGYSQGDYVEILINTKEYKHKNDKDFNENDYQEYFDNLLWNAPINGNIEISFDYEIKRNNFNDTLIQNYSLNFEYDEYCNNNYELDLNLNDIINTIKKETFNNLSDDDYLKIENQLNNITYDDIKR